MLALGTGIAAPVLPAYAKSFGVSFSTAALILIVQPWGGVVSTFPTGYLIDRIGRRRPATRAVRLPSVPF
jgi:MFS family permease